jgi:hypothetical protein
MPAVALPSKAEWAAFKRSRHDFQPGTCEHCAQSADKLIWRDNMFVCAACLEWLEKFGQQAPGVENTKDKRRKADR